MYVTVASSKPTSLKHKRIFERECTSKFKGKAGVNVHNACCHMQKNIVWTRKACCTCLTCHVWQAQAPGQIWLASQPLCSKYRCKLRSKYRCKLRMACLPVQTARKWCTPTALERRKTRGHDAFVPFEHLGVSHEQLLLESCQALCCQP